MRSHIFLFVLVAVAAQEFPAETELGEWGEGGNQSPIALWGMSLVQATGGLGFGTGMALSIILFFSMCVYCCCSGCCCARFCCFCKKCLPVFKKGKRDMKLVGAFLVFLLLSVICMGLVAQGVQKGVGGLDKTIQGAQTFLKETQDSLMCKSDIEEAAVLASIEGCGLDARQARARECTANSFIQIIDQAEDELLSVCDYGLEFASSLTDDVLGSINAVTDTAGDLQTSVNNITTHLEQIEADSTVLSAYFSELSVPDVSATLIEATKASTQVSDALTSMTDAANTIQNDLKESIENELTTNLDKAKDDVSEIMCDATTNMNQQESLDEVHDQVDEIRETIISFENMIVAGFSCFVFFGAVLPFVVALLGALCKGKCFRRCSCCMIFLIILWVCFVMGTSQLISMVLSDVCDGKELLITTNLKGQTMQVQDVTVDVPDALIKILNCDGEQTLAQLAGVESLFDINDLVDDVFEQVDVAITELDSSGANVSNSKSDVQQSRNQLDRNVTSNGYVAGTLAGNITLLKEMCTYVSPTPASLPVADRSFYRETYAGKNNVVECTLEDAKAGECNTESQAECVECTAPNNCPAGTKCMTKDFCIEKNDDALLRANRVDTEIAGVDLQQTNSLGTLIPQLLGDIDVVIGSLDGIRASVQTLRSNVTSLIDFAMDVPTHSQCKFIGNFYRSSVKEGICVDIQGSFSEIYSASALSVFLMFIGFYVIVPWFEAEDDDGVFVQVEIGQHHAVNVHGGGFSQDVKGHGVENQVYENPVNMQGSIQYVDEGTTGDRSKHSNSVGYV